MWIDTLRSGVLVLLAASCSGKDPYSPGEAIGTFHVTAKLARTTCGPTPNPWEFDVRLNHDGAMLYWIQGGAPVQGRVDATAKTELRAESVHDLRAADAKKKTKACAVARSDVLAVQLNGADAQPTADPALTAGFSGMLSYRFAPTQDSECDDQLTSKGGGFEELPCQVDYELVGAFKAPPLR